MRVHIEFFGLSRVITGKKAAAFEFAGGATFRDLVRHLGRSYPELIGDVIQPRENALQHPNVFHLSDNRFIKPDQLDQPLHPDDRIVLMSLSAGG
jgi:molybdopterin converting factor small subunit